MTRQTNNYSIQTSSALTNPLQETIPASNIAKLVVTMLKNMAQDHGYLASFQIKEILSKGENLPSLTRGQIYLAYFSREICPLEDAELREPGLCFDTTVRYKKSTITTRDWTVIRLAKRMKK